MKFSSVFTSNQRTFRNHGLSAAIYDTTVRAINSLVYLKTLQCVVIERVDPAHLELPAPLHFARLDPATLASFDKLAELELPGAFVRDALFRGDECYAVLDGTALASYGWYSTTPTLIDQGLRLHFDPSYTYMYKGFTAKNYRGKRLHAIGMMRALQEARNRGSRGLVAFVESNNFDSLKSCYRMGYKDCGRLRVLKIAGRSLIHNGRDPSPYGLELRADVAAPASMQASVLERR